MLIIYSEKIMNRIVNIKIKIKFIYYYNDISRSG